MISRSTPFSISYGLALIMLLTAISTGFAQLPVISHIGMSSLVIAILFGMILGNTLSLPYFFHPGIQFAAKQLLRAAIVLYGFRVSFQEIQGVGWHAVLIDLSVVSLTLLLGYQLGKKLFKLDKDISLLISAGAAICGAAAVLAVEDVLKSEPHKTAIAVGTVVLFGTLSMFLYPFLQHHHFLPFTDIQFGIFAGASIHEVAQALVAGSNISPETGHIAVIVKMMRVLLLVPVLLFLSFQRNITQNSQKMRLTIPWFAIGFIVVIGLNSLHILSETTVTEINQIDNLLLTMAMGAIGLETKFNKMKQVGIRPLYLAGALFIWLFLSVALMVTS